MKKSRYSEEQVAYTLRLVADLTLEKHIRQEVIIKPLMFPPQRNADVVPCSLIPSIQVSSMVRPAFMPLFWQIARDLQAGNVHIFVPDGLSHLIRYPGITVTADACLCA